MSLFLQRPNKKIDYSNDTLETQCECLKASNRELQHLVNVLTAENTILKSRLEVFVGARRN